MLLLDGCATPEVIDEIQNELKKNPNVTRIESLRVWSTNRGKIYGALKMKTNGKGSFELKSIFSTRKIEGYVQIDEEEQIVVEE